MSSGGVLDVDGRTISVTNLDKVLYPATGTRKFEVIDYYTRIAEVMLPHVRDRIVTRKRWPSGVGAAPFFEKNLPAGSPDWLDRHTVGHSQRAIVYPVITGRADLVWLAQMAALELHVPQWRVSDDLANRIIFDLDPGPRVPLHQCAQVALLIRDVLADVGLSCWPVTSGGKGIHLYARIDPPVAPNSARTVAREVAEALSSAHPDSITASMTKAVRDERVFVDWSQNSGSKTTLAPYSLRGRERPWVAAPRTWSELADDDLRQLTFDEVLERVEADGDLLVGLDGSPGPPSSRSSAFEPTDDAHRDQSQPAPAAPVVNLGEYRRKRTPGRTPEPGVESGVVDTEDIGDEPEQEPARRDGPIFVIQEHHARRLHYDFRLERDGVLVSWAVPKNLPDDPTQNRLAIRTEDHPLEYAEFSGDIPKGEYGGGHVEIWDTGTFTVEKWRDDEIIVVLRGERVQGRYVLIRTGEKNWLVHLMADEPRPLLPGSLSDPRPMLATDETIEHLDDRWAFEGKWDGYRLIVRYVGGKLRFTSRSGIDMTEDFPELAAIAEDLGLLDVVLDGEVVALDSSGRTNFTLLSARRNTDEPYQLKLFLFDILALGGKSLLSTPWEARRSLLEELGPLFRRSRYVEIPPLLPGPGKAAMAASRDRGYEGVVAKRRDSTYQQGRRVKSWLKHKNWSDIEVVVGGWRPGRGNRANTIGSLLVGLPEETGLRYVGRVGTGFTDAALKSLVAELKPLTISRSPFLDEIDSPVASSATWVLPKIVGEVQFLDWTSTGHLRHPSWRGIRRDKLPGDL
ncbi:ATP-dependent DNA ligase LigD [Gordonia araii NBRC 100433]|uniref:DNA ligase (ATP) n=1 Tax=Gordonia araii NBRC 100433 TaxID=1073574 RepID=G7H691_9ACTN|nr:ATP-dependent DNA ligase [Gordonia araii]NNG96047.1 ATP-dependent DNA ligase [Gordonia araii NBRC 100433]GAB11366.1 ATP-dependent DNA ligase LigD [Gordonia araii NBRC 100433]